MTTPMLISKIFTEIRFEKSFLFDDGKTRNDIVKELKKTFSNFDFDENQKCIIFINNLKKTVLSQERCHIFHDKILIDLDEPRDLTRFKSLVNQIVPYVLRRLEVDETTRIGTRIYYVDENVSADDAGSKVIYRRFFSPDVIDLIESHSGDPVLPRIGFTIRVNHEFSMNININYQQIITGTLNSKGELNNAVTEKNLPVIDLDVFTSTPKSQDKINGVIKGSITYLEQYIQKIWEKVN